MSFPALSREKAKVRVPVLYAIACTIAAWLLFFVAASTDLWQLAFVSLLCIAWGIVRDLNREGYFHPVLIFALFSLLMALVGTIWMAIFMDKIFSFVSYEFLVRPDDVLTLAREELILLTSTYAGYLLIRGIGSRRIEYVRLRPHAVESLWWGFYLVGLSAMALVALSGGFVELSESYGAKWERREGRGELVILSYFAYAGALLWYRRNMGRAAWRRYGSLVALLLPLVFLSAARGGALVCLIAALYMDERTGKRISLKVIALSALILAVLFALFQAFRTLSEVEILWSNYKDLNLGVGYVVALREGILGGQLRFDGLLTTLSLFVPTIVKEALGFPRAPNSIFTDVLFPESGSTFSMGVWGEANYILYPSLSFLHYLVIGVGLTWVATYGQRRSLLLAGVVAGGAVRIARGGITGGGEEILSFVVVITVVYAVALLLPRGTPSKPLRKSQRTASTFLRRQAVK